MNTIQACVSQRLLRKADRLFTGTIAGRMIELLQNARRAGATHVRIHVEGGWVTMHDDGRGVADFQQLLNMGGRGWADEIEVAEDPAGVGLFGLAPRETVIMSGQQQIRLQKEHWVGAPVPIQSCDPPVRGTIIRFQADGPDEAEAWASVERVYPYAVFCGMTVTTDNGVVEPADFVSGNQVFSHPELGVMVEVATYGDWPEPQRRVYERVKQGYGYGRKVMLNFHGQIVLADFRDVDTGDEQLGYLIEMTGAPTDLRLMLPARTRIVENEAYRQLEQALVRDAFRHIERRGAHRLPFKEWERARALGIQLPEATPAFQVGLLATGEAPEPVEVTLPEGFPLERCYRFDPDCPDGVETDEANAHLLAALGQLDEPFIPVSIQKRYDGYSWTRLPTIGKVTVAVGKTLHTADIWSGTLTCVDKLAITAATSDGREFSSPVCMAKAPPPADASRWVDDYVLVTGEAQEQLQPSEIWYHLGGWHDEGDTYDTQIYSFEQELDRFWAELLGPDERLRRSIMAALAAITPQWRSVKVFANGKIRVQFKDRATKTIQPPRRHPS